jgi:Mn2+/Fe2+ NRAMP family transporter
MFSTGQLIFAAFFVVSFAIIIFLTYKKDKKLHSKNYKGVKWVGIVFIVFIILLFVIKEWLKN